ncbi:MAG TPA: hypothetical protein VIX85_10300, partial [Acidimicrobiales bacterium]
ELTCTIKQHGNTNDVSISSPYACSVSWTDSDPHSIDPQPHWSVTDKPTLVYDASTLSPGQLQTVKEQILATCGAGKPECTYDATSQGVRTTPRSEWEPLGAPDANSTDHPDKTYEVDRGWSFSWQTQWSVKAGVSLAFLEKIITAKFEASLSHSWSESQSVSEKHTQKIPYGCTGAFYVEKGEVEITGTFQIVNPSSVDIIKNFTVVFPLANDYNPPNDLPVVHIGVVHSVQWPIKGINPTPTCNGEPRSSPPPGVPAVSVYVG